MACGGGTRGAPATAAGAVDRGQLRAGLRDAAAARSRLVYIPRRQRLPRHQQLAAVRSHHQFARDQQPSPSGQDQPARHQQPGCRPVKTSLHRHQQPSPSGSRPVCGDQQPSPRHQQPSPPSGQGQFARDQQPSPRHQQPSPPRRLPQQLPSLVAVVSLDRVVRSAAVFGGGGGGAGPGQPDGDLRCANACHQIDSAALAPSGTAARRNRSGRSPDRRSAG